MKKSPAKVLTLALAVLMMISMLGACHTPAVEEAKKEPTAVTAGNSTLVAGYDYFSNKFSPFFAKTPYDQDVVSVTSATLLSTDREGNVVLKGIEGETIAFNGTDYLYTGIADCTVTQKEDGTVVYDFKLREDIRFSDGEALTADDVIFSMYVLSDPSYDGSSTFYAQPIRGMSEYRTGVNDTIYAKYAAIADKLWAAGPDATAHEGFTEAQYSAYWGNALAAAGEKFVGEIIETCMTDYTADLPLCGNDEVALGMYEWGFGTPNEDGTFTDVAGTVYNMTDTFPTKAGFWQLIRNAYGNDFSTTGVDFESAGTSIEVFLKEAFIAIEGPKDADAGGAITAITGIEKTGNYSVRVTMTEFDAAAIYQMGIVVAPLHYYGSDADYDYANNKFGFTKGDLSGVKAKTATPLGAGPYKFQSFENGVITFVANENYYKGCPKIGTLQFKETAAGDKLADVINGTLDVTDPNFTPETIDAIKAANGGSLTGVKITTDTVDNLGYGYLGINADLVKVGDDKATEASKNLRKAFATLFAVYRDTAIGTYYGDRATVIQYPISNTSWAAPKPADKDYTTAYSTDVDGNPIYTADMTEAETYAAALNASIGFFKAAGYVWDDTAAIFTAAPTGAKLSYEIVIAADGTGDHPNYAILTATKAALETIGITLEIVDTTTPQLQNALETGTCAMWSAAWSATPDPDMYPIYHSSNIVGRGGTDSNYYGIADDELDRLIRDARASADRAFRKATYKTCLDILLDWGVEVPSYQRQNALVFSTERIHIETLTPDITTFWGWINDIEKLEMP